MAFGQASGPPASPRLVRELLSLLQEAGHADFRDARGPMGLTQRQAGGRFTRDEAEALIDRLQQEQSQDPSLQPTQTHSADLAVRPALRSDPTPRVSAAEKILGGMASQELAAELQKRGWVVMEPD
ncbi:MAG: hypothetical protein ACT4OS_00985 [Acidimicrobiales bacterium]